MTFVEEKKEKHAEIKSGLDEADVLVFPFILLYVYIFLVFFSLKETYIASVVFYLVDPENESWGKKFVAEC